uniref:Uncharacterized protein n=1 Tax=viral metagenome TaxID=1070528 RepID=A0A6C0JDD9_9ZZZZ
MSFETVFAPLDVEFCLYFYFLMVIGFAIVVLALVGFLHQLVMSKKPNFSLPLVEMGHGLLFYFVNRLLYSMCSKSL